MKHIKILEEFKTTIPSNKEQAVESIYIDLLAKYTAGQEIFNSLKGDDVRLQARVSSYDAIDNKKQFRILTRVQSFHP